MTKRKTTNWFEADTEAIDYVPKNQLGKGLEAGNRLSTNGFEWEILAEREDTYKIKCLNPNKYEEVNMNDLASSLLELASEKIKFYNDDGNVLYVSCYPEGSLSLKALLDFLDFLGFDEKGIQIFYDENSGEITFEVPLYDGSEE